MKVPYVDLGAQWEEIEKEALLVISKILKSGKYLEHEVVNELEKRIAEELNVEYVVTLNSGTDALLLSLVGLGIGPGDEVITVPNSFIATVAAISHIGAKPVMVDVGEDHLIDVNQIEESITPRTKAILPVHLEGKVCNMPRIMEIAGKHGLQVIEDAAQSFGSRLAGRPSGSFGNASCFSLHPLKNLNALGDGGLVATNDENLRNFLLAARSHGQTERNNSSFFGFVSRLDSLQAGILDLKLPKIPQIVEKRRENASFYNSSLKNHQEIIPPIFSNSVYHSYHLYVVELNNRDGIQEKLRNVGIETKIHYPRLITDQTAYIKKFGTCSNIPKAQAQSKRILSLPIHHHLSREQLGFVMQSIQEFVGNS